MATIPHPCVEIQTTELPQPLVPPWFAECILMASYLRGHGFLDTITSEVRLVRGRFGQYEVIDFLAVLFGYAVSGERTSHPRLHGDGRLRRLEACGIAPAITISSSISMGRVRLHASAA